MVETDSAFLGHLLAQETLRIEVEKPLVNCRSGIVASIKKINNSRKSISTHGRVVAVIIAGILVRE